MNRWTYIIVLLICCSVFAFGQTRNDTDLSLSDDLLFYHRALQCLVTIELKTTTFDPRDLGQLEFYLDALDQTEKRSNENPSIGILMCKDANPEVVRYALNRSVSPTMVSKYEEQLKVGSVLQRSLEEFVEFIN